MRLFGACAILLASLGFGLLCRRERKRRVECLRALTEALGLVAGELSLRGTAIPELLKWMSEQSRGEVALFFGCLACSMAKLGETSFAVLWNEAVELCFSELSRQDREELKQAGRLLGRFALREQLSGLECCRRRLNASLEQAVERYRSEKKLLLCIPTAAGCLLILLLL